MRSVILFPLLLLSGMLSAQTLLPSGEAEIIIDKGLRFLERSQRKETIGSMHYEGEWGSIISNEKFFPMLIRDRSGYDSNCFTTSWTHNLLAELYLEHTPNPIIPKMLEPALENILTYEDQGTFNFWHRLPRMKHLQRKKHRANPEKYMQRRPNGFVLHSIFLNNSVNILNDADDTALAFAAMKLNKEVFKKAGTDSSLQMEPDSIGHYFSAYRHINRKKTHFYNVLFSKKEHIRGAFCTWFGEETGFTGFSFLPFSSKQDQYMPYNANDVDCIVNANVLATLGQYGELETPGVQDAIHFLKSSLPNKYCHKCGIYYPGEFNLHYHISRLAAAGFDDFKELIPSMTEQIISMQQADGSWKSKIKGNDLQVSLYAMLALLNFGNPEANGSMTAIDKGMNYILSMAVSDDQEVCWEGGIFFSGGTVVRRSFLWRSDAVTTALALNAIAKYNALKSNPGASSQGLNE